MANRTNQGIFGQGILVALLATVVVAAGANGCTVTTNNDADSKGGAAAQGEGGATGSGGAGAGTTSKATGGSSNTAAGSGGIAGASQSSAAAGQATAGATAAAGAAPTIGGAAGNVNSSIAGNAGRTSVTSQAGATSVAGAVNIAGTTSAAGAPSTGGATGVAGAPSVGSDPCTAADPGNDTRELATPYALGTTFAACLQTGTDVDFYELTVPTTPADGGVIQVALTDVSAAGSVDSTVYVVADNGTLQTGHGADGTNAYYWFAASAGAKYRISVKRYFSGTAATAYNLTTTFTAVNDIHEPNDVRTQAATITVGTPVGGYMFAGYGVSTGFATNAWEDWFKVTLAAGNVTVTLDNLASDITGEIALYDSLGSSIKNSHSGTDGSTVVLTQSGITAGDYYLKVTPYFDKTPKGTGSVIPVYTTQPYSLTVAQ